MTKRKITIHTPESLREKTIEDGDCLEWQGYFANKVPYVSHNGKVTSVRRLFSSLVGKNFPEGGYVIPSCKNGKCVNPAHAKHFTQKQQSAAMGNLAKNSPTRAIRIQAYKHKTVAKLDFQKVQDILLSDLPSREEASKYGVHKSLICRIRAGQAWKNPNSPFAGLMKG